MDYEVMKTQDKESRSDLWNIAVLRPVSPTLSRFSHVLIPIPPLPVDSDIGLLHLHSKRVVVRVLWSVILP
jgi:hypothetical protein